VGAASLDELLRGLPAASPASSAPQTSAPVVDIGTLLYRGERARARAQEVRDAASRASGDSLRQLIDELYDLVALALQPNA
jgi:hypothetical protein